MVKPSISIATEITGMTLDELFRIAVRTGLHCAPAAHQAIGTFPEGIVRVSFANSTPAAMSTRSSPPSVKSGPCSR